MEEEREREAVLGAPANKPFISLSRFWCGEGGRRLGGMWRNSHPHYNKFQLKLEWD